MQSWRRRVFGMVGTACLVFASSCQGGVDEPTASGPVATAAATNATSAPASVTSPESIEASEPITSTTATSTTKPAVPTTTALELEEATEPEADDSAEVEEADEDEADKSDEAEEAVADESESAVEQPAVRLPLCHELEFNPEDAAGFEDIDLSYYRLQPIVASNEMYELVATIEPHPAYSYSAAWDRDGRYRTREVAYEPQTLTVEITDAAGNTMQHQLALDPPEALPYPLRYAVIPEALVMDSRGWMFAASGITYLNVRELVPGAFDEYGPTISHVSDWYWDELGRHTDESGHDTDGLFLLVHTGAVNFTCFVSFENLGITSTDWRRYGSRSMDGYISHDDYRGLIWYSEWEGAPVRSDLPEFSGECCELFVLNDGYAITTGGVPLGYGPRPYWHPTLFYSPDGTRWQGVALPRSDIDRERDADSDSGMWICHIESTAAAIRIIEGRYFPVHTPDPCEETREWIVDTNFSNWRLQEPAS